MGTSDYDALKDIPGYRDILKAVLQSQIQQLVYQLACYTEEESIILTASVADGTLSHLGSDSGKSFLDDHEDVKSQFLTYCVNAHQRKKQLEMLEKEILKVMPSVLSPPSRYAGPSVPYSPRLPRYTSPQLHGPEPVDKTRVSSLNQTHSTRVRYEPYPVPRVIASYDDVSRANRDNSKVDKQIIKIEPVEESTNQGGSNVIAENSSGPFSPAQTPALSLQVKTESLDIDDDDDDDDALSMLSTSTIPYETLSDEVDPDSDWSNVLLGSTTSNVLMGATMSNSALKVPSDVNTSENVKVDAFSESQMDLEITDVRSTKAIESQHNWSPMVFHRNEF